ncbi:hypothetical protein [Mucilaginibacter polytrichastri]|uniref:Uncharacterized protein n=1 Tax=Mucilaginibacter polytrichastri TaxID=1302689 RepID=A0A1Q5ZU16_9SPHI|nr:hypothetical protein [Mucilaginibacter polytrichastri]OKS85223.1 hypothetical protein RG47T_0667 [Mucilaginibacter polytrichastri]SFS42485.1 hypothetical protein SAMN04487890_101424 [Mucilaginibacter polytrichastri]
MTSDIDNKEWPDEYPSLKQVNPNNPFTVPAGYFSELEGRIMSVINLSESPSLQSFIVPDNYFETLSSNIVSRINIEEKFNTDEQNFTVPQNYFENMELQIKSRIAVDDALKADEQSFAVPQNYFEDMAAQIKSRIVIEDALKADERSFAVPQNYFEDMAAQLSSRIVVEEAMQAKTSFTVPENYFEELNRKVLNQAAGLEAANRKGVIRRLVSTAAFKYATAACFTLVVGAAIFIGQIDSPSAKHDSTYLHKALSDIPDNDIESYLQLHMDAGDTRSVIDQADQGKTNNVSTDDLTDYLSNI